MLLFHCICCLLCTAGWYSGFQVWYLAFDGCVYARAQMSCAQLGLSSLSCGTRREMIRGGTFLRCSSHVRGAMTWHADSVVTLTTWHGRRERLSDVAARGSAAQIAAQIILMVYIWHMRRAWSRQTLTAEGSCTTRDQNSIVTQTTSTYRYITSLVAASRSQSLQPFMRPPPRAGPPSIYRPADKSTAVTHAGQAGAGSPR